MIIIRNRLKYALTMSEANMICMQKLIKVSDRLMSRGGGRAGEVAAHSVVSCDFRLSCVLSHARLARA